MAGGPGADNLVRGGIDSQSKTDRLVDQRFSLLKVRLGHPILQCLPGSVVTLQTISL